MLILLSNILFDGVERIIGLNNRQCDFQKNILFKSFLGKEASFQRVQSRFGRKCTYVVVGNGKYEDLPCKQVSVK